MPRLRLTARGWTLAVVGVLLIALGYVFVLPYLLVPGCFAIVVVLVGWIWSLTRRVTGPLRIQPPDIAEEDGLFDLTLSAPARGLSGAAIVLDVPWGSGRTPPWQLSQHGGRVRDTMRIRGLRRGVWRVGPGTATVVDPFGVTTASFALGGSAPVLIAPRPVASPESTFGLVDRDSGRSGRGDFVDALVRESRGGDPARRIHWRQTARRGSLMVRAEESPNLPALVVVLDTAQESYPDRTAAGRSATFDEAVRVAAGLMLRATERGAEGCLIETSPLRVVADGSTTTRDVLEGLARSVLHDPEDRSDEHAGEERADADAIHARDLLESRHPVVVTSPTGLTSLARGALQPGSHIVAIGGAFAGSLPLGVSAEAHEFDDADDAVPDRGSASAPAPDGLRMLGLR